MGAHGPQDFFCRGCKPRDYNFNIFLLRVDNHPTVLKKLAVSLLNFNVMR